MFVVVRAAGEHGVPIRPSKAGIRGAGTAGVPLLLRTLTLRARLLVMTYGATALGDADLAAMQVAMTIWTFLAFALDAIAIAAQAITGRYLGAGDADGTRAITRRMVRWGLAQRGHDRPPARGGGTVPRTTVHPGRARARPARAAVLLVAALSQPLAGIVFVLDGVLIGAGDGRYLARVGLVVLVVFAPAAWAAVAVGGTLVWLWAAFCVAFMGGRGVVLVARAGGDAWMA